MGKIKIDAALGEAHARNEGGGRYRSPPPCDPPSGKVFSIFNSIKFDKDSAGIAVACPFFFLHN